MAASFVLTRVHNPVRENRTMIEDLKHFHIMFDVRTLSTKADAAILSIGAVIFRLDRRPATNFDFHVRIGVASCVGMGFHIDRGTVTGLAQRSPEALDAALSGERMSVGDALQSLCSWFTASTKHSATVGDTPRVWSDGAACYLPILYSAFAKCGLRTPWAHQQERCYRTLRATYPDVPQTASGLSHHALADAKAHARTVVATFDRIAMASTN